MTQKKPRRVPLPRPVKYKCSKHDMFIVEHVYGGGWGRAPTTARCPECKRVSGKIRHYDSRHVSVSLAAYDKILAAANERGWSMRELIEEAVRDAWP